MIKCLSVCIVVVSLMNCASTKAAIISSPFPFAEIGDKNISDSVAIVLASDRFIIPDVHGNIGGVGGVVGAAIKPKRLTSQDSVSLDMDSTVRPIIPKILKNEFENSIKTISTINSGGVETPALYFKVTVSEYGFKQVYTFSKNYVSPYMDLLVTLNKLGESDTSAVLWSCNLSLNAKDSESLPRSRTILANKVSHNLRDQFKENPKLLSSTYITMVKILCEHFLSTFNKQT